MPGGPVLAGSAVDSALVSGGSSGRSVVGVGIVVAAHGSVIWWVDGAGEGIVCADLVQVMDLPSVAPDPQHHS